MLVLSFFLCSFLHKSIKKSKSISILISEIRLVRREVGLLDSYSPVRMSALVECAST